MELPLKYYNVYRLKQLTPGMKLADGAFQILPVEMGVYLGGGNALMAQHFLHGSKVGATLYQMSGK